MFKVYVIWFKELSTGNKEIVSWFFGLPAAIEYVNYANARVREQNKQYSIEYSYTERMVEI